jgi:hypothetical protein
MIKEDALMLLMNDLASYVQMIAAGDDGIVHLAGLEVKGFSRRNPRDFSVEQGDHTGSAVVTAPYVRRAAYLWEYTNDPSGTWISAGDTLTSSIEINDLVPGTRYWFRVAVIDSTGRHPFNTPLSLIVL